MKKADIWGESSHTILLNSKVRLTRAVYPEHLSLFNTGWGIIWILQNGGGLLLTTILFPWEWINLWPQNACLKW